LTNCAGQHAGGDDAAGETAADISKTPYSRCIIIIIIIIIISPGPEKRD